METAPRRKGGAVYAPRRKAPRGAPLEPGGSISSSVSHAHRRTAPLELLVHPFPDGCRLLVLPPAGYALAEGGFLLGRQLQRGSAVGAAQHGQCVAKRTPVARRAAAEPRAAARLGEAQVATVGQADLPAVVGGVDQQFPDPLPAA